MRRVRAIRLISVREPLASRWWPESCSLTMPHDEGCFDMRDGLPLLAAHTCSDLAIRAAEIHAAEAQAGQCRRTGT
jgi:hypothetical protein